MNTTQLLIKRGNTAQVSSYVGPIGELVLNTETYTVYVGDGITPGGQLVGGEAILASIANITTTVSTLVGNISSLTHGVYGDANVAAYLPTNSTISGITSDIAAYETCIRLFLISFTFNV